MTVKIDQELVNADWTKHTWVLPCDNIDDLLEWLKHSKISISQFKNLPIYKNNVNKLKWLKNL